MLIIYSVIYDVLLFRIVITVFTVFPLFNWGVMQRTHQIWPYSSSATQNEHETMFCFSFYANFHFNGHFRHFGRPYWIEEINGKGWFAIANNAIRWRTWYVVLKKIAQKLKAWECRKRNHQKSRYDVIQTKFSKNEKSVISKFS